MVTDASIRSYEGSYNIIDNNTINDDGILNVSNPGDIVSTGVDDGIILGNGVDGAATDPYTPETNDTVVNNNIHEVFDCGIEGVGTVNDTVINHNTISYAGNNGICSYYFSSWMNDTISYNTVTQGGTSGVNTFPGNNFFDFVSSNFPSTGQVDFENNKLVGNKYIPLSTNDGYGIYIDLGGTQYNSSNSNFTNDLFENNNLTHTATMYTPEIIPSSMVVDGGRNICTTTLHIGEPPNGLVCN
ncbi:MAG TPA: hypothetical protein VMR28_01860 [Candidatus Saccharimonadales bacterium]|nr:hypothetical protein [Candidatus Saccharimonadales bacterium]